MAKEIDKIIQSKTAPKSNNVLWDDGENLKINRNGKWESIGSYNIPDLSAKEGEVGYIKNRTHYRQEDIEYQLDVTNVKAGDVFNIPVTIYTGLVNNFSTGQMYTDQLLNILNKEIQLPVTGPSIYGIFRYHYHDDVLTLEILNDSYGVNNILYFGYIYYVPIDIKFLPSGTLVLHSSYLEFSTYNTQENLSIMKSLDDDTQYICSIDTGTNILDLLTYYNRTITGIIDGKFIQYDVNYKTGEITLKHEIDIVELYNKVNSLT